MESIKLFMNVYLIFLMAVAISAGLFMFASANADKRHNEFNTFSKMKIGFGVVYIILSLLLLLNAFLPI